MNRIHPTAFIGEGVVLGDGNDVGPFVTILGPTVIGNGNWFGPHTVVGAPGEVRGADHGAAWDGDLVGTGVEIGDNNVIRELGTVHQGHYAKTVVGSDCFIMNRVSVAHDAQVGDGVTIAPGVTLGGHALIGPGCNLGIGTVTHQHRAVGPGAMVGMGSVVTKDIPPFAKAYGNPCRVAGANVVGLGRRGLSEELAAQLDAVYKSGGPVPEAAPSEELDQAWLWWRTAVAH